MLKALGAMILLVASLAALYVAKIKSAVRTKQKLDDTQEVIDSVTEVHRVSQDRSSDTAERNRVRDKYTRPS